MTSTVTRMPGLVSVMMPAKNAGMTLHSTIQSIQSQTYENWELILVDDGSTDDTFEIAAGLARTDTRIKPFKIEHGGRGRARNACIAQANGEFIAVCDADDISFPERFSKQVLALNSSPQIGVIGSWWIPFSDTIPPIKISIGKNPTKPEDIASSFSKGRMKMHNATVMMRGKLFDTFDHYKVEQRRAQDYELFKRMAMAGVQFANIPEPLLYYRQPGGTPSVEYFQENGLYMNYANATSSNYRGSFEDFRTSMRGRYLAIYLRIKYLYFYLKYKLSTN